VISDTLVHLLRDNYLEAKIRGKKSFLLQRQQLLSLAEIPTLSDIVAALADGPYGSELSKLQEVSSAVETERATQRCSSLRARPGRSSQRPDNPWEVFEKGSSVDST